MRDGKKLNDSVRLSKVSVFAVLMYLLFLSSCGSNGNSSVNPVHAEGLLLDQKIDVAGLQRNYHVYLPEEQTTAEIVLLLHGNGGSSDQILGLDGTVSPHKIWMDIALRENLILVVPDGVVGPNGKQGWNDCRNDAPTNPATDDVLFISTLLDHIQANYSSARVRVFSVGTSNGGLMTLRLADAMPERLDAIAIVVASKPVNSECVDSTMPLPILFMNGTSDPILPYAGGQIGTDRGIVFSTVDTVNFWIERNQTAVGPVQPVITDIDQSEDSTVLRYSYSNGSDGTSVEHYEVVNGGHTEPSIQERYSRIYKLIVGEQNADLETAEEIWKFFDAN